MRKLTISGAHGIEMKYGSKMCPSIPMKRQKKLKTRCNDCGEVEFDFISFPSCGFQSVSVESWSAKGRKTRSKKSEYRYQS